MKNPAEPLKIRRQYIDTLKALNRMRKANHRKPVDIRARKPDATLFPAEITQSPDIAVWEIGWRPRFPRHNR